MTELPPPAALGYLNDVAATYECGRITAVEARAVGINWVFAPVCGLDIEPKNPIVQTRSFGADPAIVGSHAAAWIRGCQEQGVLACAKHYPEHGRTTTDSHEGLPIVEALGDEVQRTDVAPFKAAVDAGVGSVMPAFVSYPRWDASGSAATFSPIILGHLRDALGFRGLIVTDAFIMGGATAAAPEGSAAAAAIVAGCDMLLYPTDWPAVVKALERVEAGPVEEALGRYGKALGSGEQRRRRSARGAPAVCGLGAVLLPLSILIALALAAGVALAVIELVGDSTTRTRRNLTIVGVGLAVFPGGAGWVRCHGVVAQRRARGFLLVVATPREDWPIRVAFLLQALAVRSPRCILKLPQMR